MAVGAMLGMLAGTLPVREGRSASDETTAPETASASETASAAARSRPAQTAVPASAHPAAAMSRPTRALGDRVSRSGRWSWPVSPVHLLKSFAAPPTPYAAGHRGIDLAAAPGAPVTAPASGVVRFAGTVVDRPVLTVEHASGVLSSYEPVTTPLTVGESVSPGDPLAAIATGGHCGSACLHVGVRINGEYVSPLLFFATLPPSILLPLGPVRASSPRVSDPVRLLQALRRDMGVDLRGP
ncbi:murein hydrolase activator EnvC family protein [Leifsonia xyli]|uniref:murein hydrolase activator EnvC family protein n=1 Tax=Leifsonia xyli TaxID=1575 RepID=UPI001F427C97|nr:M23 family metallopeptidase [Leifsonia xyli]